MVPRLSAYLLLPGGALLLSSCGTLYALNTQLEPLSKGLVTTSLIAVLSYVAKSVYELYLAKRNRRIQTIEDKLRHFYWPLLMRLEKDNAIWKTILDKRKDPESIQYRIAAAVEQDTVLKNHQEILTILDTYTYLAEPDEELLTVIRQYTRNIALYAAIRAAGDPTTFPFNLNPADKYPDAFYPLVKSKTEHYQRQLKRALL